MRPTLLGGLLAGLVLGACTAQVTSSPTAVRTPSPRPPATAADLFGPWSPTPFGAVRPDLVAAADQGCRAGSGPFPPGVQLSVIDARGGAVLELYYDGPNEGSAACYHMALTAAGAVTHSGGGSIGDPGRIAAPAAFELRISDVSGSDARAAVQWTMTAGEAGAGIARVVIIVPGLPLVEASFSGRRFVGWAPGRWPLGWRLLGLNASGLQVAEAFPP